MATNENKTKPTRQTVTAYLKALSPKGRSEANVLLKLFSEATGMRPVMWGDMVGFGTYHYRYETGREGDMFATGFALRKSGPTIYIMPGYQDYTTILDTLGPHKLGKSCLYLKNLESINHNVLKRLIATGLKDLRKLYPVTPS